MGTVCGVAFCCGKAMGGISASRKAMDGSFDWNGGSMGGYLTSEVRWAVILTFVRAAALLAILAVHYSTHVRAVILCRGRNHLTCWEGSFLQHHCLAGGGCSIQQGMFCFQRAVWFCD